jgi:CDP-diacylglycerol--serine O-phosphatidyltransferase
MIVSFSLVVCGATRLARFNVDTEHRPHFVGLPIPGAAAALASLVFFYPEPIQTQTVATLIMLLTAVFAGLMVSTVPFPSIKHLRVTDVQPRVLLIIVSLAVAMAWYHNRLAMLIASFIYAFSGPVLTIIKRTAPGAVEKMKTVIR